MCGIAGIVGAPGQEGVLARMLETQAHRGPDGVGTWHTDVAGQKRLSLGHRRLAIIDLSDAAAQPMADTSGDLHVTYNGEIYNYLEVRAALMARGVQFRTQSDTEVILEAYRAWGYDCVSEFNGMFAFALFDRRRGVLFCARDRYGEKPFLFSVQPNLFVFASEYKAILQHPDIPLDYDEWRLLAAANNASVGLDADPQTVFDAVQQLLPGEAMEVEVATLARRTWRYWTPLAEPAIEVRDERDVFAQFRTLLTDAVRLRLRSDVPVGSCLSGGLDSSAIVCLVRELLGAEPRYHAFTGRFPGTAADEGRYAAAVATHADVTMHTVEPTVDGFLDELPSFVWHNELPVGSSSQYAQWCVFRLAKSRGVTVLLDGQGADELLGGYEQYFAHYVAALRERGDSARLERELPQIRARYPAALKPPARALRDRLPFQLRHWIAGRSARGTNFLYGLRPDATVRVAQTAALERRAGFDALGNALAQDSFGRYLTTLLRYGDRNSMAHSREVRLPFCDHRLAEFALRLPPHLLMGEIQTKRLLREALRGVLPEEIRTRWNKHGFRPPQEDWFRSPRLLEQLADTFAARRFRDNGIWNVPWWDGALARLRAGEAPLAWTLWKPFLIEAWRSGFLEPLARERATLRRCA